MTQSEIKIGDTVKSFDFGKEHQDSYITGVVEAIGKLLDWQPGLNVYKIKCTGKVFGGKTIERFEDYYYPPVNGTPSFTGVCDYVEKIS